MTEFLPISSSGHLVVLHGLFGITTGASVAFDVALHWGTLGALVAFFWGDIRRLVHGLFRSVRMRSHAWDADARLAWQILFGTVPVVFVGTFFVFTEVTDALRSALPVSIALLLGAALFLWIERRYHGRRSLADMTWRSAFMIGIAQAFALLPGVSRSGITIIIAMAFGFVRSDAARFSFLLSLPAVLAAGVLTLPDLRGVAADEWSSVLVGFFTSALVGFFALRFLMAFLRAGSMRPFAWYRVALAFVLLALAFFSIL